MSPTLTTVYEKAGDPYLNGQIGAEAALDMATLEMKEFMVKNTRKNDLTMFQTSFSLCFGLQLLLQPNH